MTGFASIISKIENLNLRITAKSINDKFLTVKSKIPSEFSEYLSYKLENLVSELINRGRILVKIELMEQVIEKVDIEKISDKIKEYIKILKNIENKNQIKSKITLQDIIFLQNNLKSPIDKYYKNEFNDKIIENTKKVIKELIKEREREGKNLEEFFIKSVNKIEVSLSTIELSVPKYLNKIKNTVNEKLNEIYKYDTDLNKYNEDKILSEINFYIDKSDITEEIVRLRSHLKKLHQLISVTKEPIGNSILFTIQEMQREISTISAKYNNPDLFSDILKIQEEIQKCKEQARNVE